MQINVNSDAVVKFTNKLERLHRSAFPVVVRQTLNDAAYDMKKNSIESSTDKNFIKRKKTFFKKFSTVEQAQGFDIDNMKATVGFKSGGQAIRDLEDQESGGTIPNRELIPMKGARVSKSERKSIRANARIATVKNAVDARKFRGSKGYQYHRAVYRAGKGGHVIAEYNGKVILWRVNSLRRSANDSHKLTPLYSVEKGRKIHVNATHFMREAQRMSAKKLEQFFIKRAKSRLERELK